MMKEAEIQSLILLIDDEDREVSQIVRTKIISYKTQVLPYLQEALIETSSDIVSEKIESIIEQIQLNELVVEFERWLLTPDKLLIEGAFILSKITYFDYDDEKFNRTIEQLRKQIWLEMNNYQTPFEQVSVINQILFFQNPYRVVEKNDTADYYSLPYVLESKKGNIFSIGLLYAMIAEKLQLPIYAVDLPNHLVLAYCKDFKSDKELKQEDVLFYINPEKKGSIFSKNEIVEYLKKVNLDELPSYFEPANNEQLMETMLQNIRYFIIDQDQKIATIKLLETMIEKG